MKELVAMTFHAKTLTVANFRVEKQGKLRHLEKDRAYPVHFI